MVKIKLHSNIKIKTISARGDTQEYEFSAGSYKGKTWLYLTVSDGSVFLENTEETMLLVADAKLIQIENKSLLERIYELTNDPDVLLSGIETIKEGEERNILMELLK